MSRLFLATAVTILFTLTWALPVLAADVPYTSGGVGVDEREDLRARERDYNIKIVTAMRSGAYLSGVRVVIESATKAPILDTTMLGPILLAKLPPGPYTIKATGGDETQSRSVTIETQGLTRVDFRWGATR